MKLWCCAVGRCDQLENSRVTIRDIARLVGTSTGTVSRALNDKEGVGEELRNRIKAIAKEYGYVPRRQIQREVMLVWPLTHTPVTSSYIRGLEVLQRGLNDNQCVMLSTYKLDPQSQIRIMRNRDLAAVIYFCCAPEQRILQMAMRSQIPLVLIHWESSHPYVASFVSDDFNGGYMATKHLLDEGRRKVAFVGPIKDYSPRLRWEGFCQALGEAGLEPLRWDDTVLRPQELVEQLRENGVDGVFAWHDHTAQLLMEAFAFHGITIPDNIAVVGYNDVASVVEKTVPPLTSVYWPIDQACAWAIEYLDQCFNRKVPPRPMKVKIMPELVIRDSSRAKRESSSVIS